jgi:hypothetical protein
VDVQTEFAEILPRARVASAAAPGRLVRGWALLGVAGLFARAVWQLGARGVATVMAGLQPSEWLVLVGLTAVFIYGEGYRALQLKWLPRMCQRVARLDAGAPLVIRLFAPLHAMGLVGGPLGAVVRGWLGVGAIVVAVVVVSRFPEPWRGITDLAVASALAWALAALFILWLRGAARR